MNDEIRMKRVKLSELFADEAKELMDAFHLEDEVSLIKKSHVSESIEAEDDGILNAVVSSTRRDLDDEIMDLSGLDLRQYKKNPVLLWSHRASDPPIGKSLDIGISGNELKAKFQFAKTPFAQEIYELYKQDFLRTFSIAFIALDFDKGTKTHRSSLLLEVSATPLPANLDTRVIQEHFKSLESATLRKDLEDGLKIKKGLNLHGYVKRIVSSNEFQGLIREKIAQALKEKIKAEEVADFTARETLKQTQIEMLRLKGIVIPLGEEDAYIDRFWPKKKTEAELLRVSAIREIAEKLADLMKK
jgi:HK97 family phage prohead protease